jgi:hypothetical protein
MTFRAFLESSWLRHPVNYLRLLWKVDRRWWRSYAFFLLKMLFRYPATWFGKLLTWNRYLFLAGSTRPPLPFPPVLTCNEIDKAVDTFFRYGFVVLSDALNPLEAQSLREIVQRKADEVVRQHEAGVLRVDMSRGKYRYSFDDFGHCPEWEFLAQNEKILAIVKAIWRGRAFRAVSTGGDFVLPGGTWQPLHSDEGWWSAGEQLPEVLTVNFYVSHVLPHGGPLRQIPGTARFPLPQLMLNSQEPQWMKESIITGPPGTVILRDSRSWHGGTPNTSGETRYMPNLAYVLRDTRPRRLGSEAAAAQLDQGKWIAEFSD